MKTYMLLAFFSLIVLTQQQVLQECEDNAYPPPLDDAVKTEIVDLDLPPRKRWENVLRPRKAKILRFVSYVMNLLPFHMLKYVSTGLTYGLNKIPYNEEIIGIAEVLDIPVGNVLACNIFYELEKLCTSIIAQNHQGKIYHARNLDLGALLGWDPKNMTWKISELLHPLVVNVDFKSKNKTLFKTVHFAGTVGVFTGLKPGMFSFSLNSRGSEKYFEGPLAVLSWLLSKPSENQFASLWGRKVLEKANSFDEAKEMLSTKPLLSPVYYILAGTKPNEGIVITRSRTSSIKPMTLKDNWYILQTNYDNWKMAPFYDDRRKPAKKCLDELTNISGDNNINLKNLFNVLSTIPIRNKASVYTALMDPASGKLESYRRYCRGNCYPW